LGVIYRSYADKILVGETVVLPLISSVHLFSILFVIEVKLGYDLSKIALV